MAEDRDAPHGSSVRLRHRPDVRRLLSLLLLLNFGSIGVYLMPDGAVDAGLLPDRVETAVGTLLPPVKRALLPVAGPWLDATATRQHWTLFAPSPSEWTASLEAVAWFPVESGVPGAGGGGSGGPGCGEACPSEGVPVAWTADGAAVTWHADTVSTVHAEKDPYPHWLHHRRYRIAFNLGYEAWGSFYRPIYARWLCRTVRDERGVAPDGVELAVTWHRMRVPWEPPPADSLYRQALGGYTCHELLGEDGPSYFEDGRSPAPRRPGGPVS